MTKNEILEALSAIRDTGKDFFNACDKLANMIENMAAANDRLLSIIHDHEAIISRQNNDIAALRSQRNQAQSEVQTVNSAMASLATQLADAQTELTEHRPFRETVGRLETDLNRERDLVVGLREEVRKLHEVILTVATSVDPVVNPQKAAEVVKWPVETHGNPVPHSLTAA